MSPQLFYYYIKGMIFAIEYEKRSMADVHSQAVRSYNMSRIKAKNTSPEILVRRFLHSKGFRYRLHVKILPGKPDIVLAKYNTIIFIHGCFWHGHPNCKDFRIPKTRTEWWIEKINKNITRDQQAYLKLKEAGWKIITIWGCEVESERTTQTLKQLADLIKEDSHS